MEKIKSLKIYPPLKKPVTVYSMDEKIPQSILNQSISLTKTIENFQNLKTMTLQKTKKKRINKETFSKTYSTTINNEFSSTLYSSYNQNPENDYYSKTFLNTELDEFQKTTIQNFYKINKKDNSITARSVTNKEIYTNPFNSQRILNLNERIYKTLSSFRMENQFNSYTKRINEYHKKQKMLKLMPKIIISKIEFNQKVKRGKNKNHFKSNSQSITKINENENLPILNSNKMLHRDDILHELKVFQNTYETLYHPSSRGQFSICKTPENKIIIFGGVQSKFLNDMWTCSIITKHNKIDIKWRKLNLKDDELPISRYGHSMIYYMNNLFIFGGTFPRNIYSDQEENICIFDIKRENFYYPRCINFKSVKNRRNHIGIGIGYTMLIHGGIDNEGNYLNDMWILDCLKYKWNPLIYRNLIKIPKIAFHSFSLVIKNTSLIYNKDLNIYKFTEGFITKGKSGKPKIEGIYIFGGCDKEGNFYKNLWLIRIGIKPVDILEIPSHGIQPCPRINCSMCYFEMLNLLCIYGGKNDYIHHGKLLNDVWLFDLENFNWIQPKCDNNNFIPVAEHSIISDGNKILILGGFSDDGYLKFKINTIEFDIFNSKDNEFENELKELLK